MEIITPIRLVPDLVEELKIDDQGCGLDPDWLRLQLNEFDNHAIEQAVLLKERGLGRVTVMALESESTEDVLYSAAARGADRLLKLSGDFSGGLSSHVLASSLAPIIKGLNPGLVLTGVQAHNDLDGALGPLLAEYLGFPYVGYVARVTLTDGHAAVRKEFSGGLIAELEVDLPAVLGIQAAEQPPRYIAFSKVRQAMKEACIEEQPLTILSTDGKATLKRMYQPEKGQRARMLEGEANEIADQLVDVLSSLGAF